MSDLEHAEKLVRASNKLEYHIKQYVATYKWLSDPENEDIPGVPLANAIEESNAVNARILLEFLRHGPKSTDVNAEDFYPDGAETSVFPLELDFLKKEKAEIDQYILHLTSNELKETMREIGWSREKIAKELLSNLMNFLNDNRATNLAEKDRKTAKEFLESLEQLLGD